MKSSLKKWNKELGRTLKRGRKLQKLTQNQVSQKLGLSSPQFISNIENGRCVVPFKMLSQLAFLYKLDPVKIVHMLLGAEQARIEEGFLKPYQKRLARHR